MYEVVRESIHAFVRMFMRAFVQPCLRSLVCTLSRSLECTIVHTTFRMRVITFVKKLVQMLISVLARRCVCPDSFSAAQPVD